MRFHLPSFALGFGSAVALMGAKRHLHPVIVELGALGLHFGKLGLALIERQRENAEDLWAEIVAQARRRAEGLHRPAAHVGDGASELRSEAHA